MQLRRTTAAPLRMTVVSGLVALAALTGCASQEDTAAEPESTPTSEESATQEEQGAESPEPTPSEEPEGPVLEISIADGEVSPNGARVEVAVGEPVRLDIDSDVPGELHAHATPEQSVEFGAGTSEHTMTFEQPGVVELELHDPARVVAQFEVR